MFTTGPMGQKQWFRATIKAFRSQWPPVVVKFTATWCRPCKAIQPTYALLASDYGTAAFCSIDVDELDEVAASLQVAMMPTFCVFQGGAVVERYAGSSEDQLRAFLAKHLQAYCWLRVWLLCVEH